MLLNRALLLPLLLAGCSSGAVDRQAETDANQAEKLRELQTRVEKLEKRGAVEDAAAALAPAPGAVPLASPVDDSHERLRKLERAEGERAYQDAQKTFKDAVAQ